MLEAVSAAKARQAKARRHGNNKEARKPVRQKRSGGPTGSARRRAALGRPTTLAPLKPSRNSVRGRGRKTSEQAT